MKQRSSAPDGSPPAVTPAGVAVSALSVAVVLAVSLLFRQWVPYTQMTFFLAAVLVSARLGGFALGAFAIILCVIVAELFVFQSPGLAGSEVMSGRLVPWIIVALAISYVLDRMQRDRARSAASQADAVQRVADRAERLQRFTAHMLERVGAPGVAHVIVEEGRKALEASAAAVVIARDGDEPEVMAAYGYPAELLDTSSDLYSSPNPLVDAIEQGEPIWLDDDAALRSLYPPLADVPKQGRSWAVLPLRLHGRRIGALTLSFPDTGPFPAEERAFMLLIAQQCAQALERARLHDMELRARIRAEFAERRLALLAEASARLAASLDYLTSLAHLAELSVPEIADWCVVHLVDDDGRPRLIAASHSDSSLTDRRRALEERYPATLQDRAAFAEVLRTGELVHIAPVTDEYLRDAARDDHHLAELRAFGIREQLSVPLRVEDRVCGVVTLGSAESGRGFGENDITLAQELGRRAGNAVENARLYQAAHHASEAKSDFLAVMSHELRTPLNAIIGYSDLLLMGVPEDVPTPARRQIERIRSASTSLLHLVEEVLSFSRVEAGKEDIRISPVELGGLVRECVALIEPLASAKDLRLDVDLPAAPLKVVSDEHKIRQILTNLLSNAVKFTETGFVSVTARPEKGEMLIEVQDTGIGISAENLERIFDPFWQVEQSATRRFGGTGLGLGVARKLAKLLEGRLEVRSEVDRGSTFTLVLPGHTPGMPRPRE